jgi:hypothetical protein
MKSLSDYNIHKKSIAVVGNAKSIFDKKYGNLIDTHDLVCRINRGVVIDSISQGTKFDIWAFSKFKLIEDIAPLYPFPIQVETNNFVEIINELKLSLGLINKKDKPSTGTTIIKLLSYYEPKNLSLFGFDWGVTKTFYEEDLYSKQNLVWKTHDFFKEKNYIEKNLNCEIFY